MNLSVQHPSVPTRVLVGAVAAVAFAAVALADPPPWAPAHGWRKKNDPYYVGYTGRKWPDHYGVIDGRCNIEAVGAVLGGAVGAAAGSQLGRGDGRVVATVVGTVLGAVVGARIGREIDATDRACMGHALELAGDGRPVAWTNAATGVRYRLTPARAAGADSRACRRFAADISNGGARESLRGVACRRSDGVWEYRP